MTLRLAMHPETSKRGGIYDIAGNFIKELKNIIAHVKPYAKAVDTLFNNNTKQTSDTKLPPLPHHDSKLSQTLQPQQQQS